MSANPPILTVPPQLIEPHSHILRYLGSIKGFAEQHAQDGRNHLRNRLARGSDEIDGQQREQAKQVSPSAVQDGWQHRPSPQTRRRGQTAKRSQEDRPLAEAYPNVPLEHAQRLHDRKMRRREKAAIRRTTSPLQARANSPSSDRWLYDVQPIKKRGRRQTGIIIPENSGRSRRLTIPPDKVRGLFGQGKASAPIFVPTKAASQDRYSQSQPAESPQTHRQSSEPHWGPEAVYDAPRWREQSQFHEHESNRSFPRSGPQSELSHNRYDVFHSANRTDRYRHVDKHEAPEQTYAAEDDDFQSYQEEQMAIEPATIDPYEEQDMWPVHGADTYPPYEDEYASQIQYHEPHQQYAEPRWDHHQRMYADEHHERDLSPDHLQGYVEPHAVGLDELDYWPPEPVWRDSAMSDQHGYQNTQHSVEGYPSAYLDEFDPRFATSDDRDTAIALDPRYAQSPILHPITHCEEYDDHRIGSERDDAGGWAYDLSDDLQQLWKKPPTQLL